MAFRGSSDGPPKQILSVPNCRDRFVLPKRWPPSLSERYAFFKNKNIDWVEVVEKGATKKEVADVVA